MLLQLTKDYSYSTVDTHDKGWSLVVSVGFASGGCEVDFKEIQREKYIYNSNGKM